MNLCASSLSFTVPDPEISEVLNMRTGELVSIQAAIGNDFGKAMALRMAARQSIAEGSPIYACPLCGVPVYLVSRKEKRRFFFRHLVENGRCTAHTRGEMGEAEISARKYNGAKESQAHIRTKQVVAESLRCDPRFSDVKVESIVKSQDRSSWRKPDVQAIYNGIPVAFEIQLSTTFLRVIAERRAFYQREGGLLVWIFKNFDEDSARLSQEDIFYSNNHNLFLVDEKTLKASQAAGRLMLDCRWAEPFVQDGKLMTRWGRRLAAFEELEIDLGQQRIFLFNYDREVKALQVTGDGQTLRLEFETFWLSRYANESCDQNVWNQLRNKFDGRGIALPIEPDWGGAPSHLLNALFSAREGRPVGWRFRNLVQVALWIAARHKNLLRAFLHALIVYDRAEQIRQEDTEDKWRRQIESCLPYLLANSPTYEPERRFNALVDVLFPELGGIGGCAP